MPRTIARFGWTPDLPDHRDQVYSIARTATEVVPAKMDLRKKCPPVTNQMSLGACTGHAIGAMMDFHARKQPGQASFVSSSLFIYYNERALEGTIRADAGAQIRDGVKVVSKLGTAPESLWPYSDANPGVFQRKPSKAAYTAAKKNVASSYQRLPRTLAAFRACLAAGNPFVFGFSVYESFDSDAVAKTGLLQLPKTGESMLGTIHAHPTLYEAIGEAVHALVHGNAIHI